VRNEPGRPEFKARRFHPPVENATCLLGLALVLPASVPVGLGSEGPPRADLRLPGTPSSAPGHPPPRRAERRTRTPGPGCSSGLLGRRGLHWHRDVAEDASDSACHCQCHSGCRRHRSEMKLLFRVAPSPAPWQSQQPDVGPHRATQARSHGSTLRLSSNLKLDSNDTNIVGISQAGEIAGRFKLTRNCDAG
jgi:hypothetical protein